MNNMPKISIIIPTYNRAGFIGETIKSVLFQDFADFEIIISDDGSTDDTEKKVAAFADERIRYFTKEHEGKPSRTRNYGIKQAKGQYISFLDSDDLLEKNALSVLAAEMDKDEAAGLVYGDFVSFGPGSEKHKFTGYSRMKKSGYVFADLLMGNFIYNIGILIRKKILDNIGLFDEDPQLITEDYQLFLRIARKCKIIHVPQVIARYRFHQNNISVKRRFDLLASNIKAVEGLYRTAPFEAALFNKAMNKIHFDMGKECLLSGDGRARQFFMKAVSFAPFSVYSAASVFAAILPLSISGRLFSLMSRIYGSYQRSSKTQDRTA
jgi:glycosyltransferase involved in cell wall biosynthesis